MPIYELLCIKCNKIVETICPYEKYKQSFYKCPFCNKYMDRVISNGGFKLKGDGFYSPTIEE